MINKQYILEGRKVVPVDLMTWANWYESTDRRVARTETGNGDVSTVFLGIDHQFGDGEPLIFETLVFGGPLDQEMERYSTWEQAEAGHAAMIERVRNAVSEEGEQS